MGVSGAFREILVPERIVCTERFDEPWYEGEGLNTASFTEHAGKTTLVVTGVEMPDDLGFAKISVRLLTVDEQPETRKAALRALERVANRLRRGLGPRLRLRRVPELRFEYDTGPDAARRIEELLKEIERER